MVKLASRKLSDWLVLLNGLALIIVLNQLAALFFFRIDLTEEKRFTIKPQTINLLENLDDDVYVEVFLDGDLNPGFSRIKGYTREMLEEFRIYSGNKIHYSFTNPELAASRSAQQEFMVSLAQKGISPINVIENKSGQRSEKLVFPGAIISYGGKEAGVMFLKGATSRGNPQEMINQALEDVEFELANAIHKLVSQNQIKIGWVVGHGELDSVYTASMTTALLQQYLVFKVNLADKPTVTGYDLLIIAKPVQKFSPLDLYKLDQYIMQGGRAIFLIDRLDASMEKATGEDYFAFPTETNLDDMLFKFGLRVNMDLVQDISALKYPIVTGVANGRPQITPLDWPFFPMVNQYANHAATRNLDASVFKFASSIDTVRVPGIRKTPLLFTSPYTRVLGAPVQVSAAKLKDELKPENFQDGPKPLAYLLDGNFPSIFNNRFKPSGVDERKFLAKGNSKLVVISDGDFVRNEVNQQTGEPAALGFDPVFNVTFANQDFILNIVAYLTQEDGIINARSKEIKIRPLDRQKVITEKAFWQVVNLLMPIILIVAMGIALAFWRKRKFEVLVIRKSERDQ